jgi:nucleotide-binding universal stress UspA family protein
MCGDGRQGREAVTAGPVHGILAGYDGSPGSEQALTWAAREARAREAVLTVCQAWAPGYPAPAAEVAAFDLARRSGEETVARGVRYARALMGSSEVRPLLVAGPAAHVLCERSADAEMLVISARGHGGLAGLLLGSVSSQVAAHARGRVVVVRGHWRPAAAYVPGPVVVGVDGSAASQAAVTFAAEEAALRGAALLAVCALADSPGNRGGAHVLQEDFEKIMVSCEKEHPDVVVRRQVADGSARAELLRATCDAQMLIVGSRGRGGEPGMMLGSVSYAVLHHARCPVGVVHPR